MSHCSFVSSARRLRPHRVCETIHGRIKSGSSSERYIRATNGRSLTYASVPRSSGVQVQTHCVLSQGRQLLARRPFSRRVRRVGSLSFDTEWPIGLGSSRYMKSTSSAVRIELSAGFALGVPSLTKNASGKGLRDEIYRCALFHDGLALIAGPPPECIEGTRIWFPKEGMPLG